MVDADGTVTVSGYDHSRGNVVGAIVVRVTNTDPRVPQWLKERWGGSVRPFAVSGENSRPAYVWDVGSRKAEAVLKDILPYMIVKRGRAEIALAFQATKRATGRGRPVPEDVVAERRALRAEMKALNKRGVG